MFGMPKTRFAWVAALLFTSGIAAADESGVHWSLMAGYSDTLGTTSNYLQGGYTLGVGLSVTPSSVRPFELRFDVDYSAYNATIGLLNAGQQATGQEVDSGSGTILSGTVNLLYHVPIARGVRAYALAGGGAYYTRIELDQALPFYGCGYYCGFYGYGYYGYGFGFDEAQVAAHGVTNFGWNAGVGLEFALPYGHSWFLESRYQHVNSASTIEYLPIEVGLRF